MFSGKETGQQPGGLSPPRENHAVVTPGSKERNPTRLTSLVEQLYHLQFFFTTKPNSKNGTGLVGIRYSEMDIPGGNVFVSREGGLRFKISGRSNQTQC